MLERNIHEQSKYLILNVLQYSTNKKLNHTYICMYLCVYTVNHETILVKTVIRSDFQLYSVY